MENTNDCFAFTVEQYIGKRCTALKKFDKGCGTMECPFYKPKEFKDGVRKEVDWSKVEVDTPILVRDFASEEWRGRYFARYENETIYVWCDGRTSWSAYDNSDVDSWEYVKLAER